MCDAGVYKNVVGCIQGLDAFGIEISFSCSYLERQLQLERPGPQVLLRWRLMWAWDQCKHLAEKVAVVCHDACQAECDLFAGGDVDWAVAAATVHWDAAVCCRCSSWQSQPVEAVDAGVEAFAIAAVAAAEAVVQQLEVWPMCQRVLELQCWG